MAARCHVCLSLVQDAMYAMLLGPHYVNSMISFVLLQILNVLYHDRPLVLFYIEGSVFHCEKKQIYENK